MKHNPTFEELRDLQGGADAGVLVFYKYLDFKFPGSKFVLMIRELDSWLESVEYIFGKWPVTSREPDLAIMRRMLLAETVRFDRDKMLAARERHHADVRRYFADRPDDLLEMNIVAGEGWEKLCPFLGLPIPDAPFPHRNQRVVANAQEGPSLIERQ